MNYRIVLKEDFYKDDVRCKVSSQWLWYVYDGDDDTLIDSGSAKYSERDARMHAERAATLHHRQETATLVEYEFTPEG